MNDQISFPTTQEQKDLHTLGQMYLSEYWKNESQELAEHFKKMVFVILRILDKEPKLTNNR